MEPRLELSEDDGLPPPLLSAGEGVSGALARRPMLQRQVLNCAQDHVKQAWARIVPLGQESMFPKLARHWPDHTELNAQ